MKWCKRVRLGQKRREARPHKNENWHRGIGLEHSIHLQCFSLLSAYSLQRYQSSCEKKERERAKGREGGRERERETERIRRRWNRFTHSRINILSHVQWTCRVCSTHRQGGLRGRPMHEMIRNTEKLCQALLHVLIVFCFVIHKCIITHRLATRLLLGCY